VRAPRVGTPAGDGGLAEGREVSFLADMERDTTSDTLPDIRIWIT
jgi:hypothetical protein